MQGAPGTGPGARPAASRPPLRARLAGSRNLLGALFMLPAAALLLIFLAYPLVLGIWLGMTDTTIGQPGHFVGLGNYFELWRESLFWLAVTNTLLYTFITVLFKFGLGLWLALLLDKRLPFKAFLRAVVLLPWIIPTVLSALAWWWMYDPQFSVISWTLTRLGLIHHYIDFLGAPWNARFSLIAANIWRGTPFFAISLLAGLQTISPSLYEAAALDGATPWQRFRYVTLPMLTPLIAIVTTLSLLFTFNDFQLIYVITRGGPINATQIMATLAFQEAIPGGQLGMGSAIATAMVPILALITMASYFGLQRKRWQHGGADD